MATPEVTEEVGKLTVSDIESALSPDDAVDVPSEEKVDEVIEEVVEEEEVIEDDDKEEEDTEEKDEKKELEVKDKDEEELEYQDAPKRQEILKAFPELFKKFPSIERAIYREQQYTELFPTVSDAKQASEQVEQFNALRADVLDGNIANLLESVKKADDKAFGKITENYLTTLLKVDKDAYFDAAGKIIRATLNNVFESTKEAKKDSGEEQLKIAAQLIHKYLFNTHEIKPVEFRKDEPKDEEKEKLTKERQDFERQRFDNALENTEDCTTKAIKSAVDKHIDPKNVMTPYVRNKAVDDVMNEVSRQISTDRRFKDIVTKMWISARDNGYADDSLKKIRKAVLGKAQTILPSVIQKVKGDALKGHATSRIKEEVREEKPASSGRVARPASTNKGPMPGESSLDFLSR
jgi:hypothetical protein